MQDKFEKIFPTTLCQGSLESSAKLNTDLLKEIKSYSGKDKMGKTWSKENYLGGYTSYGSLSDMHHRSKVFSILEELLQPSAERFAKELGWNLKGLSLEMDSCWMNIMEKSTYHTLHLHPHSVLSGTYYVATPKGSVALKLEDPRMSFYMNAPVSGKNNLYHLIDPKAGTFVMFESWLRHEVPPNQSSEPRVSISFNYSINFCENITDRL